MIWVVLNEPKILIEDKYGIKMLINLEYGVLIISYVFDKGGSMFFSRSYTKDFTYFKAKIPKFIPEDSWEEKIEIINLSSFTNLKAKCFYNNFIYESESYDTQKSGPLVTETTYINKRERVEFILYIELSPDYDVDKLEEELLKEFLGLNLKNLRKSEFFDEKTFLIRKGNALILKSFENIEIIS